MSEKAKELLKQIKTYYDAHGYMPSVRELCGLMGFSSTSSVNYYMTELYEKGYIETDHPGSPRAFRIRRMGE